jgi:multiple sugar transport system permease protein
MPSVLNPPLNKWSGNDFIDGNCMVILLSGLQDIPDGFYEAARIDGANRWQLIRHVKLQLMTPMLFFQLVIGMIGALQIMQAPILLSGVACDHGRIGSMARNKYSYMINIYSQPYKTVLCI